MNSTVDPTSDFSDRPWMDPEAAPIEDSAPTWRSKWSDAASWRACCHAGPLVSWILPATGVNLVVPILIWQLKGKKKGEEDAALSAEAIEALNFQLNVTALSVLLSITIVGLVLVPIVWVVATVFMIIAGIKSYKGERYRYPWIWRVVKDEVAEGPSDEERDPQSPIS